MLRVLQLRYGLSTKTVDNLWTTVLMEFKSDIFTRDFYTLPLFYTPPNPFNYNYLDIAPAFLGT
jgi:hypothetical protein